MQTISQLGMLSKALFEFSSAEGWGNVPDEVYDRMMRDRDDRDDRMLRDRWLNEVRGSFILHFFPRPGIAVIRRFFEMSRT